MKHWYMVTLVGEDRPGIVAKVTSALYEGECNLGETSMMRLGENFTIMMMVSSDASASQLESLLRPVADSLGLRLHVDRIRGKLHSHLVPDVRITVSGADRAGIVAKVTSALAEAGLNILDLESDVAGSEEAPLYIMCIEGVAGEGVAALEAAVEVISREGIDIAISPIETLIG
ncbi:MAG: amino acid-binding protein [Gammaproteobacteria bacterium]